jgi:transcription-repair coupling factor (superfamily II helicase)
MTLSLGSDPNSSSTLAEALEALSRAGGPRRVLGVGGAAAALLVARAAAKHAGATVVTVAAAARAEQLVGDLRTFFGEREDTPFAARRVHALPSWDGEPLSGVSPTAELVAERVATLQRLASGSRPIVVASVEAWMQRLPAPATVTALARRIAAGDRVGRETLIGLLDRGGYHRAPQVEDRGEYAVRGGIVDFYPVTHPHPLRVELDDDVIEAMRAFDPASQRSLGKVEEAWVIPWREMLPDRGRDADARRRVDARARDVEVSRQERDAALARLENGLPFPGSEALLPLVEPAPVTLRAYLDDSTRLWIEHPHAVREAEEAFEHAIAEAEPKAVEARRLVPEASQLYLSAEEANRERAHFPIVELEPLDLVDDRPAIRMPSRSTRGESVAASAGPGREASIGRLAESIDGWLREGDRIALVAHDASQARRLQSLLVGHGIDVPLVARFEDVDRARRLGIVIGGLSAGFRLAADRLTVVSDDEIFGERRVRRGRRVDVGRLLGSIAELKADDYVVHVDHGIGRYRGLRHLTVADTEGDYLHLEYAGGDRLYLPVDRINLVEKYVGAEAGSPEVDRLGGTSWERVKAKTRESILAMASDLLEVHAARELQERRGYPPPDDLLREFEARFPYEETPDQQRAIDQVFADLASGRPMDRLVCGDVGFGKTEVALRAALQVVLAGKQVLVVVPTTILARQHFETFLARFHGFPIKIELFSRFQKGSDASRALEGLTKGTVDIAIGTHRLLQDDVVPKDVGLVVIDEEHRFGVIHKEKLKRLKKLVDVLTLTATPIPRTLSMALSGIRDMSVIETPPVDRQAIRTYLARRENGLIRDACIRELSRGGQVFFVHNRVETIDRVARDLRELVPEARFAVAHGQMHGRALERVMVDFLEKNVDVLVTTAIIESGLDIPNANTILIDRADMFGLAQLYQLRGRVGRSHERAYAYLLVSGEALLSRDAQKRLEALASLDDLGSGFRLAMHDLEIRGAGNLLGKQQSGQVAAVGFELYTKMLEQAIKELRGERVRVDVEPEIQIGVSAFLPEDYVADVSQRLALYKRLARAAHREELDELREEMEDRFGPAPARALSLFQVMELRRHLKAARVTRLRRQGGRLVLRFHETSGIDPDRLLGLVQDKSFKGFRVLPDHEASFPVSRIDLEGVTEAVVDVLRAVAPEAIAESTRPAEDGKIAGFRER